MKLFTGPLSMFGAKAQIAALEKGIAIEAVMVPFDRDDNYEPKHPGVLRIHPKRAEPGLVGVAPGSGEIMMPPVSVCHHVSTIGQRPPPIFSW